MEKPLKEAENRKNLMLNRNTSYGWNNYIEQINVFLAAVPVKVMLYNGNTTLFYHDDHRR